MTRILLLKSVCGAWWESVEGPVKRRLYYRIQPCLNNLFIKLLYTYVHYHLLKSLACFAVRAQKFYITQLFDFDSIWCAFWDLDSGKFIGSIFYIKTRFWLYSFSDIPLKSVQHRATKVNTIAEHECGLAPSKGWTFCSEGPGGSFRVLSRESFYIMPHKLWSIPAWFDKPSQTYCWYFLMHPSTHLAFFDRSLSCFEQEPAIVSYFTHKYFAAKWPLCGFNGCPWRFHF